MALTKKPPPTIFFIFGGSGDLNFRKLTPALFNLFIDGWMPDKYTVVGIARTDYSDDDYRKHLLEGIQEFSRRKDQGGQWDGFAKNISYLKLDVSNPSGYGAIADCIKSKEKEFGTTPTVIFYMAVAPQLVPVIAKNLKQIPACSNSKSTRIVV